MVLMCVLGNIGLMWGLRRVGVCLGRCLGLGVVGVIITLKVNVLLEWMCVITLIINVLRKIQ